MAQTLSRRAFLEQAKNLAVAGMIPNVSFPETPPQPIQTPFLRRAAQRLAAVVPDILIPQITFAELAQMTQDQSPHTTLHTMLNFVDYYTSNRKIPELKDKLPYLWVAPETTLRIGKGDCDSFAYTLALLKQDRYKPYIAAVATPDNDPLVNHMVYPYGNDETGWYITSPEGSGKAITHGPQPTLAAAMDAYLKNKKDVYSDWMVYNLEWDPITRNDPKDDIDVWMLVPGKEHVRKPNGAQVFRGEYMYKAWRIAGTLGSYDTPPQYEQI